MGGNGRSACRTITSITVCKISVTSTSENFGNISQEPVSLWIEQLAAADHDAASRLWAHFCQRLMVFARSRMSPSTRRIYDEEDAAVSAFRSLCRGIEAQRFPDVGDRGNLWALLVVITSRKIANQFRYEHQQRRNANQTLSESMLTPRDGGELGLIQSIASQEPTPAFAAEVADMSEYLVSQLPEPDLKRLVFLKLEGHTNEDAAEMMKITRRTVQRKLELIRRIWLESAELPKPNQT
jgi:DNA-directed RNA polymerase specialized sigma24 family protein